MSDHLRYSGLGEVAQRAALQQIVRQSGVLMQILHAMRELALPDLLLCSGAIYNTVWNALTERPPLTGIRDADVIYFDDGDLSYAAEDAAIKQAAQHFAAVPIPVELRNQARVHLWFPDKFGMAYPQLRSSAEMLLYFATKTYAVAVRLEADGAITLHTPFGLEDLFSFRLVPNPVLNNRKTHDAKAVRAQAIWPELTVLPWPDSGR